MGLCADVTESYVPHRLELSPTIFSLICVGDPR
jgi:hypothetical protein